MSGRNKMMSGQWYDANYDSELVEERLKAQTLYHEYNQLNPSDTANKNKILSKLLGYETKNVDISAPFYCDYGYNIEFGKNVFVNLSCYFMDGGKITIGDHCFIGPFTGFYTANHPSDVESRNKGMEQALPIVVGNNCWLGANVSVMPGVRIGDNCVIAAGSVVTKDIPDNSMVAGVPAKVIRQLTETLSIDSNS